MNYTISDQLQLSKIHEYGIMEYVKKIFFKRQKLQLNKTNMTVFEM